LVKLKQPLPPNLAIALCGQLATAAAAAAAEALPSAVQPPHAAAAAAAAAAPLAGGDGGGGSPAGLRAKEAVQALYAATRLLPAGSDAADAVLRPLLRLVLGCDPADLDIRCLADGLGTLSRFRVLLAAHHPQHCQHNHRGPSDGNEVAPRVRNSQGKLLAGVACKTLAADPWVSAALQRVTDLLESSARRGPGDRPAPAWCVLEVLQAANYLGIPLTARLGAAAAVLLTVQLPYMAPGQLVDVVGCCAATPSALPADLAWAAMRRLAALEAEASDRKLSAGVAPASASAPELEAAGAGAGLGKVDAEAADGPWRELQPDELSRLVSAAPKALLAAVANEGTRSQAEALPQLQRQQQLAALLTELACRPDDPRVAAMTPDRLSLLLEGLAEAGVVPERGWLAWVCQLMSRRMRRASDLGMLRACRALLQLEHWPGRMWVESCELQASELTRIKRNSAHRELKQALRDLRDLHATRQHRSGRATQQAAASSRDPAVAHVAEATRAEPPLAPQEPAAALGSVFANSPEVASSATATAAAAAPVSRAAAVEAAGVTENAAQPSEHLTARAAELPPDAAAAVNHVTAAIPLAAGGSASGEVVLTVVAAATAAAAAAVGVTDDLISATRSSAEAEAAEAAATAAFTGDTTAPSPLALAAPAQPRSRAVVDRRGLAAPATAAAGGTDPLGLLLAVYRLAEARLDAVLAMTLRVAVMQSAYALYMLGQRGSRGGQAQRGLLEAGCGRQEQGQLTD
ncbi:hypothetical protein Agub_g9108, partial [Astrephomene gubernaculifera]